MSELELKQTHGVREEDPHPVLSLNAATRDVAQDDVDADEQEALWNRSLAFYEQMKSAQAI